MFTIAKDAAETATQRHSKQRSHRVTGRQDKGAGQGDCSMKDDDYDDDDVDALRQQQVISINLMVFHLQPKLNRLFAVKNFELR